MCGLTTSLSQGDVLTKAKTTHREEEIGSRNIYRFKLAEDGN
jgi:hypothetical protein